MDYNLYEYALFVTESKVAEINRELKREYGFSAVRKIESRIKTEESICGKLDRKGLPHSDGNITAHIKDIAGLRLVCPYVNDIYLLAGKLAAMDGIAVVDIKDYIQNPKPNGYRSLHINLNVPVNIYGQTQFIPVEIQLRTVFMNIWAKIEHKLCYKSKREPRLRLKKTLKAYSEYIAKTELQLSYGTNPKPEKAGEEKSGQITHVL